MSKTRRTWNSTDFTLNGVCSRAFELLMIFVLELLLSEDKQRIEAFWKYPLCELFVAASRGCLSLW